MTIMITMMTTTETEVHTTAITILSRSCDDDAEPTVEK